jgi:hypothetical protein
MSKTRTTKRMKSKPKTSGHKKPKVSPGVDPREVSPSHPDAHIGAPVRNCRGICCQTHRRLNRRADLERALVEAYRDTLVSQDGMTVMVGRAGTAALRRVLGANN